MTKRSDEWALATKLVRSGTMRSEFGETSEAMFLTSGYAYDSAEQAAARMSGDRSISLRMSSRVHSNSVESSAARMV